MDKHIKEIFYKNINFDSYSKSKDFLGYYEIKYKPNTLEDQTKLDLRESISLAIKILNEIDKNYSLIYSLEFFVCLWGENQKVSKNQLENLRFFDDFVYTKAQEKLDNMDIKEIEISNISDIQNINMKHLYIQNYKDRKKLQKLFQGVMHALFYGHSFLINSEKNIIIYPHDTLGLGFICLNSFSQKRMV